MQLSFLSPLSAKGGSIKTKNIIAMKLLTLLLTIGFSVTTVTSFSQNLSLASNNIYLEQAFKEISKQTGYNFIYTTEQLSKSHPVNINVKKASLTRVLSICFKGQPLTYTIDNHYIIVKDKASELVNTTVINTENNFSGRVIDENGKAVAGATVIIKGSNTAVATNETGSFQFSNLKPGDVIVVTNVGFEPKEFKVRDERNVVIQIQSAVGKLDAAIIIAYGKTTRRLSTGNVTKISNEEIERQPVSNPLATLQGRVAGLFVNTQNGLPGGNINVLIRGKGSINAGTEPLYVVDGIPFNATPLNLAFSTLSDGIGGSTSPLNSINPGDIESIEVLKDADATAIYGSRAANGVILITTKKSAGGKTKFDINIYTGVSRIATLPKLLNLSQYRALRREGFMNSGVEPTADNAPDLVTWDSTKGTNWPKYVLGGTAANTNVQASLTGGNEFVNFLMSGNFRTEGTILPGDQNYRRGGFHIMLQHTSLNKKLSIEFSSTYTGDNNKLLASTIFSLLTLPPNTPVYDSNGNYNWVGIDNINPAAVLHQKSKSITSNLLSNLMVRYKLTEHLQLKTSFGYNKLQMDQVLTYPKNSINPDFGSSSYAYYGDNRHQTYIIEPQLEYSKAFKKASVNFLLGSSWQKSQQIGDFISGSNYSNDELLEYSGAAGNVYATNSFIAYKYASIFGRANYNYDNRYIVTASMRRDGSSRFGPAERFGNFGAVGVAWLFNKEKFFKQISLISFGKLRLSYGVTGNDLISDYQYLSTYGTTGANYQNLTSLAPLRIANDNFGWESNRKFESALELGLIKNKLLFTVVWYRNRSGNQLVDMPLPYTSGPFGHYQANLPALVENRGWEIEATSFAIKQEKVSLSFYGNLTLPKNKLLKYPGLESSGYANTYVIGKSLDILKAYDFLGINSKTGLPEYSDVNNDGVITAPEDYTIIGKTSPSYYGGIGSDFNYSNFQLNIFFQFSKQFARGQATIPGLRSNQFPGSLDRWQNSGDISQVPKATVTPTMEYFFLAQSDAVFYNASYLRLKNVSVSYNLKSKGLQKLHLTNCRLFTEGQNLITWRKKNNLYDPETALQGIGLLKSFVFGINFSF